MNVYDVIRRPLITEKGHGKRESERTLTFEVHPDANKIEIKQAVEAMYNVTIEDVNTLIVAPKQKSRSTKAGIIKGSTSAYKKAIVTVKQGEQIDFYSNI